MIFWTNQPKYSKSDDFAWVCAIINHDLLCCQKLPKTNIWNLGLIFNHFFEKHHFGAFSVFHTNYLVILGEKKIQIEICMLYHRKILTREVRSNKRFICTQSGVRFWFRPHFGKMIAAPPGYGTFRTKIVSKTYSKFQREFVDSFPPQIRSERKMSIA